MPHALRKTWFLLLATTIWTACLAKEPERQSSDQGTITFRPVSALLPPGTKVSHGIEIDPEDWPTLIEAEIPPPIVGCTATRVGPNTILLAAHCVDTETDDPVVPHLKIGSKSIPMICEMHPGYVKLEYRPREVRGSEDFALCLIDYGGEPPASFVGMSFEVIDADTQATLKPGDSVLMSGFGCSDVTISGTGQAIPNYEGYHFRIGDGKIATALGQWDSVPAYVTTRSPSGSKPALCPGDSGGPLFSGVTAKSYSGVRRVRGVNSMICAVNHGDFNSMCTPYEDINVSRDLVSAFAATGSSSFGPWARDWIKRNAAKKPIVCGINRSAGEPSCRK